MRQSTRDRLMRICNDWFDTTDAVPSAPYAGGTRTLWDLALRQGRARIERRDAGRPNTREHALGKRGAHAIDHIPDDPTPPGLSG